MPLKVTTAWHNDQDLGLLHWIQWAVMPINNAFVWLTDQRSVVVKMCPVVLAWCCVFRSQNTSKKGMLIIITCICPLSSSRNLLKALWIYVDTSWVEGKSTDVDFGRMATRQFRNVALFIMTKLCKTLKHHLLRTDLHNHISTYHSGILTLSDLTMSNFTMLVKMYTLYTKAVLYEDRSLRGEGSQREA